jgi:hypothetical protein
MALKPSKRREVEGPPTPYRVGERVRHEKFGDGLVLGVEPRDGDHILRVKFSRDQSERRLLCKRAGLKSLEP